MSDAVDDEIEGFLRSHGPFDRSPILSNGDGVDEWTVRAFLGRGGSAEVYRAENRTTGLVAALKVLCKTDDLARERFRREARLVAEIQNVAFPKFYGAGCADGRFYIAEELLEPMPLPKTDTEVARFLLSVAAGVDELHRRGFVHRDIKPRNVMMRPSTGESVLVDMGLAKEYDEARQMCDGVVSVVDGRAVGVGTPGFSAPEQFAGGRIGPAADIHALGMLANACFGGRPPRAWEKVVRRSTSSIPEQRYASIADFSRAVRRRHVKRRCFASVAAIFAAVLFCWWLFGKKTRKGENGLVQPESTLGEPRSSASVQKPSTLEQPSDSSNDVMRAIADEILEATYEEHNANPPPGAPTMDKKAAHEAMRKGIYPWY